MKPLEVQGFSTDRKQTRLDEADANAARRHAERAPVPRPPRSDLGDWLAALRDDVLRLLDQRTRFLANLEQAEREADDWKAAAEESQASESDLMAQLAKADKLAEALRHVLELDDADAWLDARDVLAEWEQTA